MQENPNFIPVIPGEASLCNRCVYAGATEAQTEEPIWCKLVDEKQVTIYQSFPTFQNNAYFEPSVIDTVPYLPRVGADLGKGRVVCSDFKSNQPVFSRRVLERVANITIDLIMANARYKSPKPFRYL